MAVVKDIKKEFWRRYWNYKKHGMNARKAFDRAKKELRFDPGSIAAPVTHPTITREVIKEVNHKRYSRWDHIHKGNAKPIQYRAPIEESQDKFFDILKQAREQSARDKQRELTEIGSFGQQQTTQCQEERQSTPFSNLCVDIPQAGQMTVE